MEIYDITKELFSAPVYPGDPFPAAEEYYSIKDGDGCNLTLLRFGSHAGTHVDAPLHYYDGGTDAAGILPEKCAGMCFVAEAEGKLDKIQMRSLAERTKRLLIKGDAEITPEAAREAAENGILLLGVEKQTVGTEETQDLVHRILLGGNVVILEGLELGGIREDEYLLCALPLKMKGADGSPVRAVLMKL